MLRYAAESGPTIRVRIPEAREVCILGRFNNWSTAATPLIHLGGWVWQVQLPRGADLRDLRFFVWRLGEGFGRLFREQELSTMAAGSAAQ